MKNCDLVVVPGDMTSQLQPLYFSVNRPFKDYLRKEYKTWLLSENLPVIPSGKIKKASASDLADRSQPLGRLQEKWWNSHSRNAALQMQLMVQNITYYAKFFS
jgi:hypothetical protein